MSNSNNEATGDNVVQFPPQVNITLQDLGTVVQIIDVVTKRGAFEGGELADVGALRNKIVEFVKKTQAESAARKQQEAESATDQDQTPPKRTV